jgi:ABC-type branched-subunit amino acid transport system substrate-binding protein
LPFGTVRQFGALRPALAALGVAVLLSACGAPGGGGAPGFTTGSTGQVKVGLLLPMTGSGAGAAKALKQAAELALFDFDNPNVMLIPKDTHGTPDGARMAAQSAVQDGAELIIGPLFAQEVAGAAPVARQSGIPMIAFSSDEKVAGGGVYLLSFLAGRDVQRIVSFAASRGKRNFAALIPQTAYGRIADAAFARAVNAGAVQAGVRASFSPGGNVDAPVRQVATAVRAGSVNAVFLPANRDEMAALGPALAANGVTGPQAQLIGTGQWDFPGNGSVRALVGGWYPAPDPAGWAKFASRYAKSYGAPPPRIASLAYDAVSLAVSLSRNAPGQRYTPAQLTRASGFQGIDGLFRLLPDGTSQRGLAILEVTPSGPRVIDPAPSSFTTASGY